MNRIRFRNDKYQVLITPSMDFLIGRWTDPYPHNFSVEYYDTMEEAQIRSFDLPEINWVRFVEIHEQEYIRIKALIQNIITKNRLIFDIKPLLKDPEILKNNFFDSVIKSQNEGNDFKMKDNLYDVINIRLINPWTDNLKEMEKILSTERELNLKGRYAVKNKIIHLRGITNIDTPYEIQLWTPILFNWYEWKQKNIHRMNQKGISSIIMRKFDKCIQIQNLIDSSGFKIR